MTAHGDLDRDHIARLHQQELDRFREARPRTLALLDRARAHLPNGTPMAWMASDNEQPVYVDHGEGAGFTDVDGFAYVDFNASDLAMFCGHANPVIVRAIAEQAARSTQFLLPTEDSIWVAEELARRYPMPFWQFTLSATQANTEAIRLARAVTGREVVLLFEGHYHGHFEEGLVDMADGRAAPYARGLSRGVTGRVRIAQFNDPGSLAQALAADDVALVLTEPALTNNIHFLPPEPGRWLWQDLVGLAVRATDGADLGTIVEIYRTGGAEVFVVRGPRGELDVPGVIGIVTELAPEHGRMVVDLEALALDARPVEDEDYVRPRDRRPHKKPKPPRAPGSPPAASGPRAPRPGPEGPGSQAPKPRSDGSATRAPEPGPDAPAG